MIQVVREWSKEVPGAWETALRAFSPITRHVPWLALRWFPMRRQVDGAWLDCGRWLLSECVPDEIIPAIDRDIITILQGPKPSTLPPKLREVVRSMVNDYQWRMYRDHRVWARELWILQGEHGGHATVYSQHERNLLQLAGLPTDPPAVGDLPYAPLDERVFDRMRERNRLLAVGNDLDALRRSGTADAVRAEDERAEKEYRRRYVQFLEQQAMGRADLIAHFTRRSENRVLPQATPGEVNAAARLKDEYIDTGLLPSAA